MDVPQNIYTELLKYTVLREIKLIVRMHIK